MYIVMNGSFLFKIIGVSLVYMYICGTTCWVGMVSCYSSTFVVSKMCRKDESAFFCLPSPPLSFIEECFCNHIVGGACCCTHHHRCCCCRLLKVRTFVNSSGKLNGRGHECERPAFRFECNRW